VTSDRRLVITPSDDSALHVVDYSGKLLHRVQLSDDVIRPRHACAIAGEAHFVVSRVMKSRDDLRCDQISKVDDSGHVITVYGDRRGSGEQQLDDPCHVTLDPERGGVMVADSNNGRVVLLDSTLRFERVLLSNLTVHKPLRLCYIEHTGRLLVALRGGAVHVYQLSYLLHH
jgi:hypothetical protein